LPPRSYIIGGEGADSSADDEVTVVSGPLRTLSDVELITADYVPWFNQQ
jgi:hypothetical protein